MQIVVGKDEQILVQMKFVPDVVQEIQKWEELFRRWQKSNNNKTRDTYISSIIHDCVKKKNRISIYQHQSKIDHNVVWTDGLRLICGGYVPVYYISVTTAGTSKYCDWTRCIVRRNHSAWHWKTPPSVRRAGWLQDWTLDGIVAGVGAVLGFVPQMLVLFLFLAFGSVWIYGESCVYHDRIFRNLDFPENHYPDADRSGCVVFRVSWRRERLKMARDRKMTIMTTTFIPCGAKLPIIALIGERCLMAHGGAAPALLCWNRSNHLFRYRFVRKQRCFRWEIRKLRL